MYLVDSNVISELLRPAPSDNVRHWANRHIGNSGIPTVVIFEVRAGAARLPEGRRRDEILGSIERAVARFGPRVYALDRPSAEMAAELQAAASKLGRTMSNGDAMIAGVAAIYGLTLVTRNLLDFETTGIDLINPWND